MTHIASLNRGCKMRSVYDTATDERVSILATPRKNRELLTVLQVVLPFVQGD